MTFPEMAFPATRIGFPMIGIPTNGILRNGIPWNVVEFHAIWGIFVDIGRIRCGFSYIFVEFCVEFTGISRKLKEC